MLEKQTNLKITFFCFASFIFLFCLVVGGNYILHRIAIIFILIFFIFKCFLKENKVNKVIGVITLVVGFIMSTINWILTAMPEPSNFFRIFNVLEDINSINMNGFNICLSQLASILGIVMVLTYLILFLIMGKKAK